MAITILVKLTGLIKKIVFSYNYGVSNINDADIISLTIPSVIFALIVTGIAIGYISPYIRTPNEKIEGRATEFTNNSLSLIIQQNIALLVAIAAGAAIYFVVILFTKIDDVTVIANELKKKFRKADAVA